MPEETTKVVLGKRFQEALVYATNLHGDQYRKGGTCVPYIAHLLAVSSLVIEHGGGEDEAIAGLLHDAVEDRGGETTLQEIREQFGDHVAEIVDACSDTRIKPKPEWKKRKEGYLRHLPHATQSALLVSAADKLHNLRSITADYRCNGEELWKRFNGGREGTLWYYRGLIDIYHVKGPQPLADELERTYWELLTLCGRAPDLSK